MSEPCLRENIVSLGYYLRWCMEEFGCSDTLHAHTAYVGHNAALDSKVNYWYVDGAADDVQINAALAYVNGLGGGSVMLDYGTFTLADPISFPGNELMLLGVGAGTLIDGDGLANNEHAIVISGRDDSTVKDLSIQTEDAGGKTSHCIFIENGSDRFLISNVTFLDSDHSNIWIEGTTINDGHIHNCKMLDADNDCIYIDIDDGNYLRRLKITDCEITSGGARGIMFAQTTGGYPYTLIQGNTIHNNGYEGIFAYDFEDSTIEENEIYSNGWSGIYISTAARNVGIYDNNCYQNGRHGIFFAAVDDGTIEGNNCNENDFGDTGTYDGIYVDGDSDDNIILGNKCNDNDRYGINVAGARNRVKENDFSGNTTGAFNDGGTDTATPEINVTVENTNANIGRHPVAQMLDGVDTTVRFGFTFPMDFHEIVTVQVVVVPGGTGNLVWNALTDYGEICATQDYNTHSDSVGATTTAVTTNDLECLDVSAALNIATPVGGDRVGLEFFRDGDNAADTVGATVYAVEVRLRYV